VVREGWAPLLLAITVASGLGTVGAGCRAFDESLLDASHPSDAGPGCPLARPAARPMTTDGPDGDEVLFAIKDVVLDQRDSRWATIGYDLDGLCSMAPDPVVECLPPAASGEAEIDGEGGIDNTFGHNVVPLLLAAREDLQSHAAGGQGQGLGAVFLILRNWNGEQNDPQVEGIVSQTVFGSAAPVPGPFDTIDVSDGGLWVNGEPRPVPAWEGQDHFWLLEDGFLEGDLARPRVRDDNGYVRDGLVVLRLPDRFPLILGGDRTGVQFVLSDVVLTAQLSADGSAIEQATLAGRWAIRDILSSIELAAICPGTPDYFTISRLFDLAADVRALPGSGGGLGSTCDAISIGLRFETGVQAQVDGVMPGFPLGSGCTDGGVP